ncbi:11576_t:CDS:2 [Acaulospora colombiana]|uniref:11576_t:CDS:1 n=1 Tax=Acaulospora colombiana TaxID=27376 RepID=A0ACA9LC85_9GLOM|nr:11576_t:CDS:2 [Acaulospora colombiana]
MEPTKLVEISSDSDLDGGDTLKQSIPSGHDSFDIDSSSDLDPNEIVKEIPIYLSQQLSNKLYAVQFPVRPRANPYVGKNTPREARYKPQSDKLELDIPLQTNSLWYNRDRGEELMLGLNDKEAQTIYDRTWKRDQPDGLLDKQTLQSTVVPPQANYWMGVMKDGGLHLTPVRATLQLRPGLKYLDKIDEKNKNANKKAQVLEEEEFTNVKSTNDDPGVGSSKSRGAGKGKNATADKTADKSMLKKNSRPKSQGLGEEDTWMKMKYCDDESIETSDIFDRIYAVRTDSLVCKTTSMNEYLDQISAFSKEFNGTTPNPEESRQSYDIYQYDRIPTSDLTSSPVDTVSARLQLNDAAKAASGNPKSQGHRGAKVSRGSRGTTRGGASRGKKGPVQRGRGN